MLFMQTLMHKSDFYKWIVVVCLLVTTKVACQPTQTIEQIGHLLDDALFFSDNYITPATDAAVYQASSNWVTTPKKKALWNVSLSIHTNVFFVPKSDRNFVISNSDFSFFTIENATSAIVPTALGNDAQVWLVGQLTTNPGDENTQPTTTEVRLKTPEGIDQESVVYPYLQGSIGLWYGTEFVAKYSTNVKLKKGHYQVYGAGLKHNFSQYFKNIEAKNIYFSGFFGYSKEDITFNFLDVQTDFGNLGLNEITGLVDTWQFQINASKQWKKWEVMSAIISNTSDFKYQIGGPKGQIEELLPFQSLVNKKLEEIYKSKTNYIGEVSCRYQISKIYVQTSFAFGKFVNSNFSIQYEF
jgi:hypothetical protein